MPQKSGVSNLRIKNYLHLLKVDQALERKVKNSKTPNHMFVDKIIEKPHLQTSIMFFDDDRLVLLFFIRARIWSCTCSFYYDYFLSINQHLKKDKLARFFFLRACFLYSVTLNIIENIGARERIGLCSSILSSCGYLVMDRLYGSLTSGMFID